MKARLLLFFLFIIGSQIHSFAQCAAMDFSISPAICLNERTVVEDTGMASLRDWDFCSGDFSKAPSAQLDYTLSTALGRPGIEFAKDGNLWYAFVTGTWASTLYRVRFANGLDSAPTSVENLGDLGGQLIGPGQVRIMKEGNEWFGLIHNAGSPGGELLKLSFGDKLSNSISVTTLASGLTNLNSGLAVGRDESDGWVCILTSSINYFTIIKLGFNLSAPLPTEILNSVTVPDQNNLGDVDLIKECDEWFGFATNLGNGNLYRLKFGTQLFSAPTIEQLLGTDLVSGGRVRIVKEGTEFFLLSTSLGGAFYKTSFGSDLNNPTPVIINEGSFGTTLQNSYGLGVAKENSVWNVSVIDLGTGKISKVSYSPPCPVVVDDPDFAKPIVHYLLPGTYTVALTKTLAGGSVSKSKNISVSNSIAPEIAFTTQNNCAQNDVLFQAQVNGATITSYDWDFGDTNTSAQPNPSHIYTTAGTYPIELQVTASNGCTNFSQADLTIYNQPISDFSLPSALPPICSNQSYLYTNSSTFDPASNPTWEWLLNGTPVSTSTNLMQAFSSTANQVVKLKASIPGCSNESTQTITGIQTGALVDFSASTGCQGSVLQFTNNTSGAVINYSWDFGDGNMSNQVSPTNVYSTFGNFNATLHADNGVCNNSATKPITIYSKPQPDFSLDLPPFSCQGTPSQFNDLTPNPTDSNLSSWAWNFDDVANGSSSQRNPLYTYSAAGPYNVSLDVTTNFGCSASVQKMVTITTALLINFNNTPACVNQPTQFTDASSAGVKSWLWKIDNSTYMISNPVHTFTTSGPHNVELTITGTNDCIAKMIKTVMVPVAVTPNFSIENACSGKPSTFLDITSGVDPVVIRNWDFGGLGSATGTSPQYIFATGGSYSVKLNTTHQSGCIYLGTKTISVGASPKSMFTSSAEGGPPPLTIKFSNSSTGASSYLWKFNDKANTTSLLTEPSFTFNELGEYQVELTSFGQQGCTDTFIKPIYIVEPKTDLSLTSLELLSDPNSGSLRPLVTIKNNGNIAVANISILIDLSGGGSIKEKMQINLQPNQSFTQALVSELLPKGLSYVCAQVNVEKDENLFDNKRCSTLTEDVILFAPYPNPSQGQLYIDWIAASGDVANLVIFNSTGANAYDKKITATQPGLSQIILDISTLGPGIYFVVFSYGSFTKTHRFMVN